LKDRLEDGTLVVPGAPAGFGAAARGVLADVLRLDFGTASIEDDRIKLRGLTCRELIRSEVGTSATSGLPQGFKADVAIGLRETGCVVAPPASCQKELDGLTRDNTVLFGQGTTVIDLDASTERVIGEAAAIIGKCPGSAVTIEGHANRDGEASGFDNMDLSLRRALRVRDELVRRGIDPGQLSIKAYGSTRPLVPYGTPEARSMNRRVQFTVAK
jgi:outer membrane protein OmpA-like peptidoglycan-associated protein